MLDLTHSESAGEVELGRDGSLEVVSDAEHATDAVVSSLDSDDRAWLQEQIRLYADLLTYLHDNR